MHLEQQMAYVKKAQKDQRAYESWYYERPTDGSLSPAQRERQIQLGNEALELRDWRAGRTKYWGERSPEEMTIKDKLVKHIGGTALSFQEKKNEKRRIDHYELNQQAYQVQAVKDAGYEGVHTSFGNEG